RPAPAVRTTGRAAVAAPRCGPTAAGPGPRRRPRRRAPAARSGRSAGCGSCPGAATARTGPGPGRRSSPPRATRCRAARAPRPAPGPPASAPRAARTRAWRTGSTTTCPGRARSTVRVLPRRGSPAVPSARSRRPRCSDLLPIPVRPNVERAVARPPRVGKRGRFGQTCTMDQHPLPPGFAPQDADAAPLHLVGHDRFQDWLQAQPALVQAWLSRQRFTAAAGSVALLPGEGGVAGAVVGIGDRLDPCAYAHAPTALPGGDWRPVAAPEPAAARAPQLGCGLGAYRFDRYKAGGPAPARLALALDPEVRDVLAACVRVRDMVNTPAQDMGPAELEAEMAAIARAHGAGFASIVGDALLEQGFPAIHAVGRASHRAPRPLRLDWDAGGEGSRPHLVLVGKGVCFDTGGLDVKPADGMRNMKKDIGGAAHAIALAELLMARRLPLRLTLLVPAVDNAIGPDAYRPGEVLATRKGVSVEIDNTDAEGRVVLCDALALAGELGPDLVLDFATLTGAARIALGPDLPALF